MKGKTSTGNKARPAGKTPATARAAGKGVKRKAKASSASSSTRKKTARPGKSGKKSTTRSATRAKSSSRAAPGSTGFPKRIAGKKTPGTKKTTVKVKKTASEAIRLADPGKKMPKTRLSDKRLREFKETLLRRRGQIIEDVQRLNTDAFDRRRGDRGERSTMPIHMADIGSDNWEQEFDLMLMDNERAMLREIDAALRRIENRTYGVCQATHRPISIARLNAKPWARYCIEYARLREQGMAP